MSDGTSRLHILREDTPVIIDSNSLNFVLYSLDLIAPLTEQTVIEPSQKSEIIPELESLKSIPTVPPPHPPTTWNCPLCTFCNLISSTRCEMCGTENPHRVSSNDDDGENIIEAQENNPATPADFAVWMCGQCTFMNQMDTLR